MKKALITGITGMVGSHLADFLLENTDWDVYGVCRWRSRWTMWNTSWIVRTIRTVSTLNMPI